MVTDEKLKGKQGIILLLMTFLNSCLLGILQGLTEFFPVSSSGHLVLVQKLLPSFLQPGVLFDATLHFGTLAAVLVYFRKKILKLTTKELFFLAIATLPAIVIGYFFQQPIERYFALGSFLALEFIVSSLMNLLVDRFKNQKGELTPLKSAVIGLAQAVAIIPAISRSGATIFTSMALGLDRKKAAEFSFLMSVPVILGANLLEIVSHYSQPIIIGNYLVGFLAALVTGLIAIRLVVKFLVAKRFTYFAIYCFVVGLISLFIK